MIGRIWRAIVAEFDAQLVLLILGLTMITAALWPVIGRMALVVPGGVVIWLALPSRQPFVATDEPRKPETRRSR